MAAGITPVLHSASSRMNIQSPAFNSEDPATWGLAKPERRVWGLAVNAGRLYYAVNNSTREIWSVGLAQDGSFTTDVRLEIVVPQGNDNPLVTDIAFDKRGRIYLAQRGSMESRFDYSVFAKASVSNTLRYSRDPSTGGWIQTPDSYAIGKPADHLEASGGIAIGNRQGRSCDYLWSTGDTLEPQQVVHGIQGNAISLVRPANTPPVQATFTVYDNRANKDGTQGHVGDVEVLRDCQSVPPVGIVPIHWKSGSSAHSKSWSHQKYGSSVHAKSRSHWKYASHVHTKRRSHWKHASNEHSKRRSHWKFASHVHTKRRSHWKHASNEHSKRRSHWKFASHVHTKRRSHWKHASNEHSKRRSHWKFASHVHTKRRSHWKHASNEHSKRRSHFKLASKVHTKKRSHFKIASRVHTKQRSHFKTASRVHTKRRSHFKIASRVHTKRRSHFKAASRVHTKGRSHFKTASRVHTKGRSHFKTASRVNIKRPPRIRQIKHRIRTAPTRIHRLRVQRPNTRLR